MFRGKARFNKTKKETDHRIKHRTREILQAEADDFSPRATQKPPQELRTDMERYYRRGQHDGRPDFYNLEMNDRRCEQLGYAKEGLWTWRQKDYLTRHKMEDIGAFCPRRDRTRHVKTKNADLGRERGRDDKYNA